MSVCDQTFDEVASHEASTSGDKYSHLLPDSIDRSINLAQRAGEKVSNKINCLTFHDAHTYGALLNISKVCRYGVEISSEAIP